MFDWLGGILSGLGDAISIAFENTVGDMVDDIWTALIQWLYTTIFEAVADLFTGINDMGAEIFNLSWVDAVIRLFSMFGWALFVAGIAVAVFDVAIEAQTGRVNLKTTAIHILKGFMACALVGVVPVELYKFCISLQHQFAYDLTGIFAASQTGTFGDYIIHTLNLVFNPTAVVADLFKMLCILIAFAYCVIKVFFANIKRGGILLVQVAVGELYMFSLPRGYADGFTQWCKQVVAICLTAFLQTTLLFLGMMSFTSSMLMGLGIMLAANEVPRIAQQFGLDSSVRVNMSSVIHSTSMAYNLGRAVTKATK